MIEAVNSAVASAQVLRSSNERNGGAAASSSEPASVTAPQAPFISPFVTFNTDRNVAVLQLRDSQTGDVVEQIPSETTLARQEQAARSRAAADEIQEILTNFSDPLAIDTTEDGDSTQGSSSADGFTQFAGGSNGFNAQQVSVPAPEANNTSSNPQFDVAVAAFSAGERAGAPQQSTVSVTA